MYYLVKSQYQKEDESGRLKTVKEQHLFDATGFTEAEALFYKFTEGEGKVPGIASNRSVVDIRPQRYDDIADDNGEKWFKVKAHYMSLNETTGKEKKVPVVILVNAETADVCLEEFKQFISKWLIPVEVDAVQETPILEVILRKE